MQGYTGKRDWLTNRNTPTADSTLMSADRQFRCRCGAQACAATPRTSTMLTQCSGLHSIRKMCHFASIVSQDGEIRFCTASCGGSAI